IADLAAPLDQRRERGAEIVDHLVREVEPGGDAGEDELGDVLEARISWNRQHDPVGSHRTPAPTTTSFSYSTGAWPAATPYTGSWSASRNPPSVSSTVAATAGDRYRHLNSARFTRTYNRPRAEIVSTASDRRGPTTTVFEPGFVRTTYSGSAAATPNPRLCPGVNRQKPSCVPSRLPFTSTISPFASSSPFRRTKAR